MEVVGHVLDRLGLTLNEEKTRVVNVWRESFTFLGFDVRNRIGHKIGKPYPHIQPSGKSLQKIKSLVKSLTGRNRTGLPLDDVLNAANAALRGWVGYFPYRNCSGTLSSLKGYVEERVRTHLRKRHKIRSRGAGYARFPSGVLYARYGLYKVPTTAGWTKAHALR